MWERRYGFPEPRRTDSGHRRYSDDQVAVVEQVLALRDAGLSLPAAIARAQTPPDPEETSMFSALRTLRPELDARAVRKPILTALSHAIEDEMLVRADARIMLASFQREAFYRDSEARWRELASTARVAAVFADFAQPCEYEIGPSEIPIGRWRQIAREWALVLYGGRSSICMVARELAGSNVNTSPAEREFELLWTVDPEAVRALARIGIMLIRDASPDLGRRAELALTVDSASVPAEQVRLTAAVVNRTLSLLS